MFYELLILYFLFFIIKEIQLLKEMIHKSNMVKSFNNQKVNNPLFSNVDKSKDNFSLFNNDFINSMFSSIKLLENDLVNKNTELLEKVD